MTRIAVILAGGEARRMGGQDKAEVILGDDRLIDMVLERLTPQVDTVIISGTKDYGTGLEVLPDLGDGPDGPSAALYAMVKSHQDVTGFMTVPVDSPFFPAELYERLSENGSAVAAGPDQTHPTFAFWSMTDLISVFSSDPKQNRALHQIAQETGARKVSFRAESYFTNFNRPEDFDLAI